MAKTAATTYLVTIADSTNQTGNTVGLVSRNEPTISITDGGSRDWTLASGVTARNIFPAGMPAATDISVFGVVIYNSTEPLATRNVSITIDGAAAATKFGREFAMIADTSLTLTTNAANPITVIMSWRVED